MEIKIKKLTKTAIVPTKGTKQSAGYDLYVDSEVVNNIEPHETKMMQTNIDLEIPDGYFGAVFPRSGISTKRGLRLANCVAVIDSDYRGGIGIPIHNDTDECKEIQPYERVAQLVILPYMKVDFVETDKLEDTERGSNGFGSTGK